MALSLGIRLVIVLPTFLFLTGFSFKAIIEKKRIEVIVRNTKRTELWYDLLNDFFFILAIDSIFLSIANGIILVFELEKTEIGILAMMAGVILSMCLLIGIYARSYLAGIGVHGIFGLLAGEFAYFCFYDTRILSGSTHLETTVFVVGTILGILIGYGMLLLVYPDTIKQAYGLKRG